MRARSLSLTTAVILAWSGALQGQPKPRLTEWERGIALEAPGERGRGVHFWFYEWNMFDAVSPGQHTHGTFRSVRTFNAEGTKATLALPGLRLSVDSVAGGADLLLEVTNTSGHDWPELAGIIPCLSPGRVEATMRPAAPPFFHVPLDPRFADHERKRTFFVSRDGLALLGSRDIHFNGDLRAAVDRVSDGGQFVFSNKWPTSEINSEAGLLIRESADGRWVTGIGWDDYVSVQGHNPWSCMHVCVRVGPLPRGHTRSVRGKLYLFRGSKANCLTKFRDDFPSRR